MNGADRAAHVRGDVQNAIARGDVAAAWAGLERLWRVQPGPANASFISRRSAELPAHPRRRDASVAIVRSFTLEPAIPVLRAAGLVGGLDLDVRIGDFGTYGQDLLDPSRLGLPDHDPDVVIVAVHVRDVLPELTDGFREASVSDVAAASDRVIDEMSTLLGGFRRQSAATVILHGFEEPPTSVLGVADAAAPVSQREAVRAVNARLRALTSTLRDVHFLDLAALVARIGTAQWYDEDRWTAVRMPMRTACVAELAAEWLRFVQPAIAAVAKVCVVDLDDTLWGGVLGEDGVEAIRVGPGSGGAGFQALQRTLLDIRSRGVLLAVCSKNDESDAVDALRNHPEMLLRPDDFAATRINWSSKADNLRSIAAELNVGLDSVAFVDNSAFECDQVRRAVPDVAVIELDDEPTVASNPLVRNPLFERLRVGVEDRERSDYYAREARRREARESTGSISEYLASLGTVVRVAPAEREEIARVAQLTQKTNQFNLTTRRYGEAEIEAFVDDPASHVFAARATDRFGDHGLIGAVIVRADGVTWKIDTMLLSCRVIGRGVETAVISAVAERARRAGVHRLAGDFVPTRKNAPARDFYPGAGFEQTTAAAATSAPDGASSWAFDLRSPLPVPDWIRLIDVNGGPS